MQTTSTTHRSIVSLAKTAMITAIYVVMTLMLSPLSFGVVQVRFSEMLNYTALFNRRYVWAVTLGVFLANLTSPTALLDVPIGTLGTLVFIIISRWLAKLVISRWLAKLVQPKWAKFTIMGILFALSMFTIAGELTILTKVPFWPTYATIALGEAISMAVGGVVMMILTRFVDLDK